MKNKFSIAISLAVILALLLTSLALADDISIDNDVQSTGNQNSVNLTAAPGATVTTSAQIVVDYQGNKHLVAGSAIRFTVSAQQTELPSNYTVSDVSNTVPSNWDDTTDYKVVGDSNISFTAPSTPGTYPYVVKWDVAEHTCDSSQECLTGATGGHDAFTISLTVEGSTNVPPTVNAGGPYSGVEGSAISLDGTVSDPDGDTLTTTWTYALVSGNAAASCTFGNASSAATSITCNDNGTYTATLTADDGHGHVVSSDATVTVDNANPVVAAPMWSSASVACRAPATLTGINFTDAGVIDHPWNVNINWGDGSSDLNYNANAQGAQANQSYTYNTPGTYSATVGVTDKDSGFGSNSTSGSLSVLQSYTVNFLQPFDNSSPSQLITNTMKSGRVVPVKVTIYDDCAQSYVTDPATLVRINLLASGSTSANDAVETYADAGTSNGNTLYFRWTSDSTAPGGGFWIYNLDSRTALSGSALAINTTYRVDVFIGTVKATTSKWALLKPVK